MYVSLGETWPEHPHVVDQEINRSGDTYIAAVVAGRSDNNEMKTPSYDQVLRPARCPHHHQDGRRHLQAQKTYARNAQPEAVQ